MKKSRECQVYMCGHSTIGAMIWRAGVFAAANAPFMLQNVGGTITRCALHWA